MTPEDSNKFFLEKAIEFQKSFVRYLVIGSGAAMGLILNYSKEIGEVGELRHSLLFFATSICLAVAYFLVSSAELNMISKEEKDSSITSLTFLRSLTILFASIFFLLGLFHSIFAIP